jgi:hypothetical protein
MLRFMDDFYFFSDNVEDTRSDFLLVQHLLGEKSLNINPEKTSRVEAGHTKIDAGIDAVKKRLLDRRREFMMGMKSRWKLRLKSLFQKPS